MAASVGVLNPSGAPSIGGGATTGAFAPLMLHLFMDLIERTNSRARSCCMMSKSVFLVPLTLLPV
jgi:hypothetical protein